MTSSGPEPLHIAVQYLAAAGISFLPEKEDDSHTNMDFSSAPPFMRSRPLNQEGVMLAVRLDDFSLNWLNIAGEKKLGLPGRLHQEVLDWISATAEELLFEKQYSYNLHYSLPYEVSKAYQFQPEPDSLQKEIHLRDTAQRVLHSILKDRGMKSEIRIWPHHFDTGAYAELPDSDGISVGLGLAIPDSVVNDYYYYLNAYHEGDTVSTRDFKELTVGKWSSGDFEGAVLEASGIRDGEITNFFNQAISAF